MKHFIYISIFLTFIFIGESYAKDLKFKCESPNDSDPMFIHIMGNEFFLEAEGEQVSGTAETSDSFYTLRTNYENQIVIIRLNRYTKAIKLYVDGNAQDNEGYCELLDKPAF